MTGPEPMTPAALSAAAAEVSEASQDLSAAAADLFSDRGTSPARRRLDQARREVTSAVARIARQDAEHRGEDPAGVFEKRGLFPGEAAFVDWRTKWGPQLEAAQALIVAARQEVRDALAVARGYSGASWEDIAVRLGYRQLYDEGKLLGPEGYALRPAEAAWQLAATGKGPGERVDWPSEGFGSRGATATWRCWSCGKTIWEGHPDNGVADAEEGHADGCERFAREVAAERARWDADE